MYDQNQSSGSSVPPRDTGSSSLSGGVAGSSGTWGASESQSSWSSTSGTQGSTSGMQGQQRDAMGHGQGTVDQAREKASEMADQARCGSTQPMVPSPRR